MIFDKARDEKKTGGAVRVQDSPFRPETVEIQKTQPVSESSVSCQHSHSYVGICLRLHTFYIYESIWHN